MYMLLMGTSDVELVGQTLDVTHRAWCPCSIVSRHRCAGTCGAMRYRIVSMRIDHEPQQRTQDAARCGQGEPAGARMTARAPEPMCGW
jgi:hypothetical protein